MAAAGIAVGLGFALAGSRVLASRLYGFSTTDPSAYALAAALVLTVALAAGLTAAARAASVEPTTALRQQ